MGKLSRFMCVFTPMALTVACLICLLLVFLGGQDKSSSIQSDTYFFKADASKFTSDPNLDVFSGTDIDNDLFDALKTSYTNHSLNDIYTIYLWNYCTGNKTSDGGYKLTYCSPRKSEFWFNPVEVWGLNDTSVSDLFPKSLNDGLKVYEKVSKWNFVAYEIAFWATALEIAVGIFALFSRWGSCVTTIVSSIASTFVFAAALTTTLLFSGLVGTFDSVLKPYGIKASLSSRTLATIWLAVAFSLGAGFFWLISTCCCSGRSEKKKVVVEKTPYTYERVSSPHLGNNEGGVPMHNIAPAKYHGQQPTAYEPFRHQSHA